MTPKYKIYNPKMLKKNKNLVQFLSFSSKKQRRKLGSMI
jgi:hypothetical protein